MSNKRQSSAVYINITTTGKKSSNLFKEEGS